MNFNNERPKFKNSKKSVSNDFIQEKSPLSSPPSQDNSSSQPSPQQFNQTSQNNKRSGYIIPGRMKPGDEIKTNDKCGSCNEKDATRLCLNCNKIYCDGCALDHHEIEEYEGHKIIKLNKVVETIESEKIKFERNISNLENLLTGKEDVSKALKIKEDEAMEEVDAFFQNLYTLFQNQRENVKKKLQQKLADIASENSKRAFKDTYNSNKASEVLDWIQYAKNISEDIEKNRITDNNSILCKLYKQEEYYKNLDTSKLKNVNDGAVLDGKNFLQIQLKENNKLLEALKQENIIEIIINQSKKSQDSSPMKIVKIPLFLLTLILLACGF